MNRPEQILHMAIARFLDLALPEAAWWTTIPAGGGGKLRGAILKGMGYRAGTPDILIIYRNIVIWFELKAPKGRLSKAQKDCRDMLVKCGCRWALVRSIEDAAQALWRFKVPLKAAVVV